ncbi:trypsin-like peptidase domain-containing protein [Luteitalea sp.]|uniref:S1C family serine protease n=1 Tax=Luteitalea sp. TaxID=2004800 RepID=UPI0025C373CF|nr:trypsin-like peptidase domain-containing protein [Luteitalea sp.]
MRRLLLPLALVVASFFAGMVVTGRFGPADRATAQAPVVPPPAPAAPKATVSGGPLPELADVAERVIPSVVNISAVGSRQMRLPFGFIDEQPTQSAGSGVVIRKAGNVGYVLTNAHVIGEATQLSVVLWNRRERPAELVGIDPYADLALLRVTDPSLQPITWGDSSRLRVAEWVMAVGNPYQLGETVTLGIVSALGRTNPQISVVADYIQTDAAINPGNSGGALVNRRGELIGINTWIYSESGGYQGIGFAVPSNLARDVAAQLEKFGKVRRGTIAGIVRIAPLNPGLAQDLDVASTDGVVVYRIRNSGDAWDAGLRAGDVIVGFNRAEITGTEAFERSMLTAPVGSVATLRVRRARQEFDIKVPITEAPFRGQR